MKQPHAPSNLQNHSGFTLIELMVTIAIAAILLAVAAPSYTQFARNAELSEAVSSFTGAVNATRANSMKQGRNTYLVPQDGSSWSSGWRVYADIDWSQAYTAGTDELVIESSIPSSGITITTPSSDSLADGYLLFNGSGYLKSNAGAFQTGKIKMQNQNRTYFINIDRAGRVRTCKLPEAGCN
jgi:type IV fimbrial biogenesis protein FimT